MKIYQICRYQLNLKEKEVTRVTAKSYWEWYRGEEQRYTPTEPFYLTELEALNALAKFLVVQKAFEIKKIEWANNQIIRIEEKEEMVRHNLAKLQAKEKQR